MVNLHESMGPGPDHSQPLDLQSDSHLLPDTLLTTLRAQHKNLYLKNKQKGSYSKFKIFSRTFKGLSYGFQGLQVQVYERRWLYF